MALVVCSNTSLCACETLAPRRHFCFVTTNEQWHMVDHRQTMYAVCIHEGVVHKHSTCMYTYCMCCMVKTDMYRMGDRTDICMMHVDIYVTCKMQTCQLS